MLNKKNCPLRHQNGNCLAVGGFCTAVSDEICYGLLNAYDHGKNDALELLNGQEPRVLTLEEVLGGDECWFEYINGSCGYADVYIQDNKTTIIHRTTIRSVEVPTTDYMKKWRCWSYRPTEEQRKAVKWNA